MIKEPKEQENLSVNETVQKMLKCGVSQATAPLTGLGAPSLKALFLFLLLWKGGVENTGKGERSPGIPRLAGAAGIQICRVPLILQKFIFPKQISFCVPPFGKVQHISAEGRGKCRGAESSGGFGGLGRGSLDVLCRRKGFNNDKNNEQYHTKGI